MKDEFRKKYLPMWIDAINNIFPQGIPERCEWTSIDEIIKVLNVIGKANVNHTFYPTGGGLDLTGVDVSHEKNCIKLYTDGTYDVVKPSKLIFNSFKEDGEGEWSYFRLETYPLEPSKVYEEPYEDSEEVVCIDDNMYIARSYWDMGFYYGEDGMERRFTARDTVVTRFLKGSFVIFAKPSIYNKISGTYDGRHNRMTDEVFRNYIERAVCKINTKE